MLIILERYGPPAADTTPQPDAHWATFSRRNNRIIMELVRRFQNVPKNMPL